MALEANGGHHLAKRTSQMQFLRILFTNSFMLKLQVKQMECNIFFCLLFLWQPCRGAPTVRIFLRIYTIHASNKQHVKIVHVNYQIYLILDLMYF